MKPHAIVSAIVAMSLAMGGPVFAQGEGDPQQQRKAQRQAERANRHQAQRDFQQQQRQRQYELQRQRMHDQQQRREQHQDARGAGPDHNYHRGDRLPPEYRHRNYVVDDWRGHHLSAPPRGYHWVQVGSDYVLVAIATGIILQLLLNN